MKTYPFKFLDSYGKEDRAIFFGREEEIDELYRMVFQTNLLLVYGASGTGKTSLVRCGLANRFKPTQWLDLFIRRGSDINASLLDTIRKRQPETAVPAGTTEDDSDWIDQLLEEEDTTEAPAGGQVEMDTDHPVAKALQDLYLATFTPIYLIFDQFEELYTLGNLEEQRAFNRTIETLVQLPLPVKILIVMREEYLANLYELERAVPQLRNKKLRLEPMDLGMVQEVILSATARNPNSNIHLAAGQEPAIAETIVDKIREGAINVKLPYLQVFMDRLYRTATGLETARSREVTFDLPLVQGMGTISDVLREFLEQQSRQTYQKLQPQYPNLPPDIVWRLLSPFATVDGTKVPLHADELTQNPALVPGSDFRLSDQLVKEIISELEARRILRYRSEENVYEVAHDTLALQIAEKRSEEETAFLKAERLVTEGYTTYQDTSAYLSSEQLAFIRPYEARLEQGLTEPQWDFLKTSKARRRRQRRRLIAGLASAFVVALAVIAYILFQQASLLQEQAQTAKALAAFQREEQQRKAAEAGQQRTRLLGLLQSAEQIARGNNCPPREMWQEIDSLYTQRQTDAEVRQAYESARARLENCPLE